MFGFPEGSLPRARKPLRLALVVLMVTSVHFVGGALSGRHGERPLENHCCLHVPAPAAAGDDGAHCDRHALYAFFCLGSPTHSPAPAAAGPCVADGDERALCTLHNFSVPTARPPPYPPAPACSWPLWC